MNKALPANFRNVPLLTNTGRPLVKVFQGVPVTVSNTPLLLICPGLSTSMVFRSSRVTRPELLRVPVMTSVLAFRIPICWPTGMLSVPLKVPPDQDDAAPLAVSVPASVPPDQVRFPLRVNTPAPGPDGIAPPDQAMLPLMVAVPWRVPAVN